MIGWLFQTSGDVLPFWSGTQQGEGFEFHMLALGLAVALILNGAGMWSLDAMIARPR